ncbi:PPC domain-containing protein [Lignipirellula cremea]|uniref:Peptidase C-terminal archaeal/bacterial domain-containing protein n=1 Tax=Lignipirellula cremea TaxID=2528010 RepID=A0A518E219_9BACT|nr:PPC domain-containing protein [Lignipirellula cremea]QDU98146.1 hypothetical protein Pla8534_60070 [Lignipirellula cremea]
MFHLLRLLSAGCLVLLLAAVALAELPALRFDRLTPLSGAAGGTVLAEIAGADLEGVDTLLFDHPGLTATPVAGKEKEFTIAIAADTPPGVYDVRLVGRWGVSNPRLFAVSHGLVETEEIEKNNDLATAQPIAVNTAVACRSDSNNQDVFRFPLTQGQRVVIDCQAGKLDSIMDAVLTLTSADGRQLASSSDYNGRDPLIDFAAPIAGDYYAEVHDLSFRGGFPYRLVVTDHPSVDQVSPRVVQAGQSVEMTAIGRNLGPQSRPAAFAVDDSASAELPWEARTYLLQVPSDLQGDYRFIEHPTDHTVLPTAATCTLTGMQTRLDDPTAIGAHPVLVVDMPTAVEAEPNDTAGEAQPLTIPAAVSGRFDQPRDADWFEFEVEEKGDYAVDVYCERINGRGDPYCVIVDDKENRVLDIDDFGIRLNDFDGHLRDPVGMISLQPKRKYKVLVQDRYQRGGPRYQYVLTLKKPEPDFFVAVTPHANPQPHGVVLWRGGAVRLDVVVHQRDGYNGPITITAEDLPPGVHAAPTHLVNNSRGAMVLWSDDDAADFTGPIRLVAVGQHEEQSFTRNARSYAKIWGSTLNSSRPTRELVMAVRDSAPFAVAFEPEMIEVTAGESLEANLVLNRRWSDFTADVTVLPLSFPGQFKMANGKFSGSDRQIKATISVQANTTPGDYTLHVEGQAQVPFSKEADSKERPNTLVTLPSRPLTVRVMAPKKE